jgi:uncharacterized protein
MSVRSEPVTFLNQQGLRLFGIVSKPAVPSTTGLAVILLSPGIKSRVAPHRLYNKIADSIVDLGLPVLRFDFSGLGDSEGTSTEVLLADLYGGIQLGRYVDDTRAAVAWVRAQLGVERCLLVGLCGGGITGVLAAARDAEHIAGIVAFGLPVNLDGSHIDKVSAMTVGQLTSMRDRYLRKVFDPRAWARLLSFKTDYRLLLRAFGFRPAARGAVPPPPTGAAPPSTGARTPPVPAKVQTDVNPLFAPGFLGLLKQGRPVLLIFSEMDRLYWEYREKFWESHREQLERSEWLETRIVKEANHIFTFREWQQELMAICNEWLRRRILDQPADPLLERHAGHRPAAIRGGHSQTTELA